MKRFYCGAVLLALAGCTPPPPPPPPVLTLNIVGSAGQNADPSGQGNTVPVRLYQLTATGKFQSTDIYSLMGQEAAVLGTDEAGASEQFLLAPGGNLTETIALKPNVAAIGVAVLFRDINHSTWRLVAPAAAHGATELTLQVTALQASLK